MLVYPEPDCFKGVDRRGAADVMRELLAKIKSWKKNQVIILILLGFLLLILAVPTTDSEEDKETEPLEEERHVEILTEEEKLEQKLAQILSHVSGIGKTEIMITLKSDGRRIVEKDTEFSEEKGENSSQRTGQENTVYEKDAQGQEIPYITEEIAPEISGVLVIAQGAGNSVIVKEITEAVMALFGVEAHKIKVMKME